jgi:plastocyanin
MLRFTNAFIVVVAATLVACSGYGGATSPIPNDGHTIAATPSLAFTPATLTVSAGQAVTFAFGSVAHNVFFDQQAGAPSDIDGQNASVSVARTFGTPGNYHYTCHIHPGMQGTVVVQ